MERTLVIGDIHGCFEELLDLIALAGLGERDRIVSVGDMVDRGPHSLEVWRFFKEHPSALAIRGNHEQKCLRWHRGELEPALSQRICRAQHGEAAWAEAMDYFATLPRWIDLEEALVVHGFWHPGQLLQEQHPSVLTGTMSGARRVSRLGRPWYELYDGPKPLIVGHLIYDGPRPLVWQDRVYGLDTGCVHGQRLTGLLLPDFEIVSVPARANHWSKIKQQWAA